jgi:hypothetical protein
MDLLHGKIECPKPMHSWGYKLWGGEGDCGTSGEGDCGTSGNLTSSQALKFLMASNGCQ